MAFLKKTFKMKLIFDEINLIIILKPYFDNLVKEKTDGIGRVNKQSIYTSMNISVKTLNYTVLIFKHTNTLTHSHSPTAFYTLKKRDHEFAHPYIIIPCKNAQNPQIL